MNIIEETLAGLVFESIAQAHEYADEAPNLTPRERRRIHTWADQWQTAGQYDIQDRVSSAVAEQRQSEANVKGRLRDADARVAQVHEDVEHDRMDPGEAFKQLGALRREIRECHATLDSMERAADRISEVADMEVDDYLAGLRARFPAIRGIGTATLTLGYLQGREESPFVIQARESRRS